MGFFPISLPPICRQQLLAPESPLSVGGATGTWGNRTPTAWPAANRALYIPFRLYAPASMSILTVFQGGTVSGNADVGIYAADGTRLSATGSIAANVNANGSLDGNIPDIVLGRGLFYFAIAVNNAVHTFRSVSVGTQQLRVMGMLQQDSAFPLPSSMAPASISSNYLPTCFLQMQGSTQEDPSEADPALPALSTVHPWSIESVGSELLARGGHAIKDVPSGAWPGANWAVCIPFTLCEPTRFQRLFVFNGSVVSGNIDLGIYAANGGGSAALTRLASSGSIAQTGTDTLQTVNIDVTVGPGTFYLALACNNTTAQFRRASMVADGAFGWGGGGTIWNTAAFPLPALLSPNTFPDYTPCIGAAQGTVV